MTTVQLNDLTVLHGKKTILKSVNLTIPTGQCLVVIGESGAGKTMLSRAIIGDLPDSTTYSGQLFYNGIAHTLSHINRHYHSVMYMVQNPMSQFNTFQKISSHFIEMLRSYYRLSPHEALKVAEERLRQVNLDAQVLQAYPFELSGGMLQRIMFAMALCIQAEIYILDEPTSALDYDTTQFIVQQITQLKQSGRTIVMITHDYAFARQVGDRMLVLKSGQVLAHDTIDNVLNTSDEYIQFLVKNPFQRLVEET